MSIAAFNKKLWTYYEKHKRDGLPWRHTTDPYKIMVSEIMLQQTQVQRVIPKYQAFLKQFPTIKKLAHAGLRDVLAVWLGLGYNRRARFLHLAAKTVVVNNKGIMPNTQEELVSLPGIGINTAGAIMVYAHNAPVLFIETNVRSVFLHEFFPNADHVTDAELLPFIEKAINKENPREWYWALMDYGTYLKQQNPNLGRRSKHYSKQSTFKGSDRQLRGKILKIVLKAPVTMNKLVKEIEEPIERLKNITSRMVAEGLIRKNGRTFKIT